ncbi:HPr kinase/phosphorylase [Asaia lannensis]|uniref:Aldolase n=1 Tax=Asaia lannensis NBRC 102526 TaxID=1307926 RepID=A0ABT1CDD8_9PROT|nr:aldolase [Asaia lannensis]MCO6158870.1 aldolase [Asaia lannensis NBRC 102526]GBR00022.1 HPr kinase [Asaia lannensis NBRC 102526]
MIVHALSHNAQISDCTSPFAGDGSLAPPGSVHASCAALEGTGVLLSGPSGSGKSSLLLRLIDSGFSLVGDDRICLEGRSASPAPALAGLIGIRGLGIVRMPYLHKTVLGLHVQLVPGCVPPRLPERSIDEATGLWQLVLDGFHADSVSVIRTALRCFRGDLTLVCGLNGGTAHSLPSPETRNEDKLSSDFPSRGRRNGL